MKFYLYLLLAGASLLSIAAVLSPPYSFYPIMRGFLFIISLFSLLLFWRRNLYFLLLLFIGIAILYNPFLPLSFPKAIQTVINIVSASFLVFIGFRLQK